MEVLNLVFLKLLLCYSLTIIISSANDLEDLNERKISFPNEEEEDTLKEEICLTPSDQTGFCMPITRCYILLRETNYGKLRQYMCGFRGEEPKVCCPSSSNKRLLSTTQSPIKTKGPTKSPPKTRRPTLPVRQPNRNSGTSTSTTKTPKPAMTLQMPSSLPKNCGTSNGTLTRIVGGQPSSPGNWPWMTALIIDENGIKSAQCGGALVSDDAIITAAHCVVELGSVKKPSAITVRLGEHNILEDSPLDAAEDFPVVSIVAHPDFVAKTYYNDIAIIKLGKKVKFNKRISPVCLPYDSNLLRFGDIEKRPATITGWGKIAFNGPSSSALQQATLEIVSENTCKKAFERWVAIDEAYICAANKGFTKDSCQGDSGGPLVMVDKGKYYLMGVVSFGRRCATKDFPGVYARVTHFLDWIQKNL